MNESDVIRRITEQGTGGKLFIKWWRREEDWVDFDLVDRFVANAGAQETQEIEGFELVSDQEVWDQAKRLCGTRLNREGDEIRWDRNGKLITCYYSPENLLKVLDVETRGNLVD